jgi:hypothetical protein
MKYQRFVVVEFGYYPIYSFGYQLVQSKHMVADPERGKVGSIIGMLTDGVCCHIQQKQKKWS